MNYRLNENKITHLFEIINITSKVVVKTFVIKSKALTYLRIVNNPTHGLDGYSEN